MRRVVKVLAVALLLTSLGVALVPALSGQTGGQSPLVPPGSRAYGRSFEAWNVLHARRVIEDDLGGGTDLSDTVGRVRLLPGLTGSGDFEFNVQLPPGTPFVVPTFVVFGERYDDPEVPDDNPNDPILDFIFENARLQVVLDGRVVLEGTGTELQRYLFGPVYFDEPIVYEEPDPRGPGLNATSALFVLGIGGVYHPLPVGRHTLVITLLSDFFGDGRTTYNITVTPK